MDERQQIEKAIAELENHRGVLSDDVINASVVILREKLAALELAEQQRKLVTILFADIVGSTNIVKHLDPEDALTIMDGVLKCLAAPVEKFGGQVVRFNGDGFKAVFGMLKAREIDPEMAIRAGLGILKAAQELGGELEMQWGLQEIQVRVGINTGLVAIVGETEGEDTVMGSTVNLAKRVEEAAPAGGLLITRNTYLHVRGVFSMRMQEAIRAKGFEEPIPVYLVLRVKPRAFKIQTRGVEGIETRMVGRDAELLILQNAFRDAVEGHKTQVITVAGEAGVGKSRLLDEFDDWIELLPDQVVFFQGRALQVTENLPYALLKDVFAFRFQIQESDNASQAKKKFIEGFSEVLGDDNEGKMRTHIIGQLLGFDFSDSPNLKSILDDPQQIHDRGLMYLCEYFQSLSESDPIVVFLEDIHWADDSSLDMLNQLTIRIPGQRLLIVCLARHRLYERRPYWGEGLETHHRLELQPLSNLDSRELVTDILQKVDRVPQALQELVVKGAEGNPFYIEELIKMLIEDDVIITGEEHWLVELQRLAVIDVPATLTGVLQARLEGLPPGERKTLQQASVVGHIFWDDAVEYIGTESTPLIVPSAARITRDNLSSLRKRELIYHREESSFTHAAEYTFKHTILRDVIYRSVLKRVRKDYHSLVAEWLILNGEERSGEYSGLIADHLELAGKNEEAAIYLYHAGEQASKRYANAEAVAYFTRGLALTPEMDYMGNYDLLLAREKVLDTLGDRAAQQADLAALKGIAEILQDVRKLAQAALRQMIFFHFISKFHTVVEMAEEAIRLVQEAGDVECEAGIHLYWGMSLESCEEAIAQYEQALFLSRTNQFHQLEADSLRSLGLVHSDLGDFERSKSFLEHALHKSRQIGYKRGEAAALNALGIEYEQLGDIQFARKYFSQAYHISRKIGDRVGEATFLGNLGWLERCVYDFDKAIDLTYQSLAIWREVGGRFGEQGRHGCLGWLFFNTGEYEKAIYYFKQALGIAQQINYLDGEMGLLAVLLERYSQLGDFEDANTYYERMMKDQNKIESLRDKSYFYLHIGVYLNQVGDHQGAAEYCRKISEMMGDEDEMILELYRLLTLGPALNALGELIEAESVYQQAISLGQEMHWPRHAIEAQAGLACIYMTWGDLVLAFTQVDEILVYIDENTPPRGSTHPLDGTEEPFCILLTCYKVLKANNDPRATKILTDAFNLLQTRAANISDEALRNCFLENVAANQEIVKEFDKCGLGCLEI